MKIEKLKKKNNNQYTIILSDKTSLSFYDDTIIEFNLLGKKEIDEAYLKEVCAFNQKFEAYYKALKDIKAKLRTEKELETRLKKAKFSKQNIEFAINKLKLQGYINDELYIKSYIADQVHLTLKGPKKIILELNQMGLNTEFDLLEEYPKSLWQEKVEKIIRKKEKANHNLSNIMLRQKIKKDLINLGYESWMIEEVLNNYEFLEDNNVIEKECSKELRKLSRKYDKDALKQHLKANLYKKGFSLKDIEEAIKKIGNL